MLTEVWIYYYFSGSHQRDKGSDTDIIQYGTKFLLALLSIYQLDFNEMAKGASPSEYHDSNCSSSLSYSLIFCLTAIEEINLLY